LRRLLCGLLRRVALAILILAAGLRTRPRSGGTPYLRVRGVLLSLCIRDQPRLTRFRADRVPVAHFLPNDRYPFAPGRALLDLAGRVVLGRPTTGARRPSVLWLPRRATAALVSNSGTVYFDLAAGHVVKLFAAPMDAARREIANAQAAATIGIGPAVLEVDTNGRWYTTAFVEGRLAASDRVADASTEWELYLSPLYHRMLAAGPVQTRDPRAYVEELAARLDSAQAHWRNLLDVASLSTVTFHRAAAVAAEEAAGPVAVALSHGDLNLENIVVRQPPTGNAGADLVLLDWEGAATAVLGFDLFDHFVRHASRGILAPATARVLAAEAFATAATEAGRARGLTRADWSEALYVPIYCLERLLRFVETRRPNRHNAEYISRWTATQRALLEVARRAD